MADKQSLILNMPMNLKYVDTLKNEILNKNKDIDSVTSDLTTALHRLKEITNDEIFNKFTEKIQELKQQEELIVKRRFTSKLNSLYNGSLPLKDTKHKFLNLSKYELPRQNFSSLGW